MDTIKDGNQLPRKVTSRRDAELIRYQHELIGRIADSIAHQFNEILTFVGGQLDLLSEGVPSQILRSRAERAIRALSRGIDLSDQLLSMSSKAPHQPEIGDMNDVINHSDALLRSAVGGSYILRFDQKPVPPAIFDAKIFVSVIIGLLINAREATPPGGMIEVVTADVEIDDERAVELSLRPGRYGLLVVRDDGEGMDSDVCQQATEPMFTTKDRRRHVGLGLFQASGFALRSGGRLELSSAPGIGTAVRIFLPAT